MAEYADGPADIYRRAAGPDEDVRPVPDSPPDAVPGAARSIGGGPPGPFAGVTGEGA